MKFEYLPHTADAKFRAYGKTKEEAIANAILAIFNMVTDITKVKPVIKKEIVMKAQDIKALLYDFLDELLFFMDTEGIIFCNVEKITLTNDSINAVVWGDSYKNYEVHGNVKSMTYSDMLFEKQDGRWVLQVVVDI